MKTLYMILPLALILSFMVGCQDKEAVAELEEQNKASFRYWVQATENGNYKAWDEVCSKDYTFHFGERSMSLEEHKYGNNPFAVAFPDLKYEINSMLSEENKVTARVTLKGTHTGEYFGIAPTGKKIEYNLMLEARFKNGKIVEAWGVGDQLTLMMQLGYELKLKEGEN